MMCDPCILCGAEPAEPGWSVCADCHTNTTTEQDGNDMTGRTYQVIVTDDALMCPKCKGVDIREHDRCERWNVIHWRDGAPSIAQQSPEFETVGLICADCQAELDAPEGFFDRAEWY